MCQKANMLFLLLSKHDVKQLSVSASVRSVKLEGAALHTGNTEKHFLIRLYTTSGCKPVNASVHVLRCLSLCAYVCVHACVCVCVCVRMCVYL